MNYYSYLRVSTPDQVRGDGFDRQRSTIQGWIRDNTAKASVDREFAEQGFTGSSFDRPTLGQLFTVIVEAHGHHVDSCDRGESSAWIPPTVLVERSDRLAREVLSAELILKEFRSMGVRVIDCEANLNLTHDDDPSKVLIRQIMSAVAEFDRNSIVQKLRKARDRKRAKTGKPVEGAKPFGYYDDEKECFQSIELMHAGGKSSSEILEALHSIGYKTRSGRPWHRGTLYRVLKRLDNA